MGVQTPEEEALRRAEAYVDAGADAILVHSQQKTQEQIVSFCSAWSGRVQLALVPRSYPQSSFKNIAGLGKVGLIIWSNYIIRAAVAGMQRTFESILRDVGTAGVEEEIIPVHGR